MKNIKKSGFGIIEVLISSSIIISVLGALVFAGRTSYQNSLYIEDKNEAMALAQEGIEITRQIRDTNWLDASINTHWNDLVMTGNGEYSAILADKNQKYGIVQARLSDGSLRYGLVMGSVENVKINSDSTDFTREVSVENVKSLLTDKNNEIDKNLSDQSIKVNVKVSWGEKSVTVSEILTNWRPNY
ncbi:MAG: hypothetical protein WCO23_03615 [bacterium]